MKQWCFLIMFFACIMTSQQTFAFLIKEKSILNESLLRFEKNNYEDIEIGKRVFEENLKNSLVYRAFFEYSESQVDVTPEMFANAIMAELQRELSYAGNIFPDRASLLYTHLIEGGFGNDFASINWPTKNSYFSRLLYSISATPLYFDARRAVFIELAVAFRTMQNSWNCIIL